MFKYSTLSEIIFVYLQQTVFNHCGVFAYQIYDERVIIHDMEYAPNITDII